MHPSILILVRHCQAAGQEPDAALTDTGIEQSGDLAAFLSDYPVDYIATSQFTRARQSVEPFAKNAGMPINLDPRFNERTLSAKPIENWQEVVRDSIDDHNLYAPGGESARQLLDRAWAVLNDVHEADHTLPLVVTHGNLMALVLHSLDPTFGYEGWSSMTNPDVYLLRTDDAGQMTIERIWRDL